MPAVGLLGAVLLGCVSTPKEQAIGGRINLSAKNWEDAQKHQRNPSPAYVMINKEARKMFTLYCPEAQCDDQGSTGALYECRQFTGGQCGMLSVGSQIVWPGDIYVEGRRVHGAGAPKPIETIIASKDWVKSKAILRLSQQSGIGVWQEGSAWVRGEGAERTFKATFKGTFEGTLRSRLRGKTECSGKLQTDNTRKVAGVCHDSAGTKMHVSFSGEFERTKTGGVKVTANADGGRYVELVF